MSTSGNTGPTGQPGPTGPHINPLDLQGGLTKVAIQALPPDIQALLKPGKTSDRIQQAITWAAKPDPVVVAMHRALDSSIEKFEDIARASLANKDAVAKNIARRYRHRAALTGAVTSLPGGLWAVVAAGADVQLTAAYSVRMAAMIAQAYGYDTSVLEEQAHLADVLALVAGIDSLRGVGNWLTREGLVHVLPEILPKILVRLSIEITEDQAAKWVGRIIPGVGAIVGGGIDYGFLRAAGERAIAYYHNRFLEDAGLLPPGSSGGVLGPAHQVQKQLAAPAGTSGTASTTGTSGAAATSATESPHVVEGSLVSPTTESARVAALPAPGPAANAIQAQAAASRPLPVRKRRPPERTAVYLGIFAVLALAATVAACAALVLIVGQVVQHIGQ